MPASKNTASQNQIWATPAQTAFLTSFLDKYMDAQKSKKYHDFWATVNNAWFTNWPEIDKVFPGKLETQLTGEECSELSNRIESRINQLKTWFRWRVNPQAKAGRRGRRNLDLSDAIDLGSNARPLREYEMFARLYYDEKVRPIVDPELQQLEVQKKKRSINFVTNKIKEIYNQQNDAIKAEVRLKVKEYAESLKNPGGGTQPTPEQYLRAIEICPDVLTRILKGLAAKTGWSFTALLGGPHPMANGKILTASIHVGENIHKANFSHVYQDFGGSVMTPYTQFLESIYPAPVRDARSLAVFNLSTIKNDDEDIDADGEEEDEFAGADKGGINAPKGQADGKDTPAFKARSPLSTSDIIQSTIKQYPMAAQSAGAPVPSEEPVLKRVPSVHPSPTMAAPTPAEEPVPTITGPVLDPTTPVPRPVDAEAVISMPFEDPLTSWSDATWNEFLQSFGGENMDADNTIPYSGTVDYSWVQPPVLYNHEPTSAAAENNAPLTSFHNPNAPPVLNACPDAATHDMASQPEGPTVKNAPSLINAPSRQVSHHQAATVFPIVTNMVVPALCGNAPSPANAPSLVNAPSPANAPSFVNAPSPANVPSLVDAPLPQELPQQATTVTNTDAQVLINATAHANAPSSPESTPQGVEAKPAAPPASTVQSTTAISHAPETASPQDQYGPNTAPSGSDFSSKPPVTFIFIDSPCASIPNAPISTPQPLSEVSPENRRSHRPAAPSKRTERLNSIGTNTSTVAITPGQENAVPGQPPEWVEAAKTYLFGCDLGAEWRSCVESWALFEEKLEYGALPGAKGHLPVSQRPEEWTRWLSKSKNGVRAYDIVPTLSDAAEFGITLQKWWHELQPPFRKTALGIPAAVFTNPTPLPGGDDWKDLRKGGANGVLSLLTMLSWWGKGLAAQSQWQEDSSADWKATVLDVSKCLYAISETTAVKKRKADKGRKEGGNSKRARNG